jgi:hypothetical protein
VVRIDPPPPRRVTRPIVHELDAGSRLLRIYRPEPHGQTATGFRWIGPLERFDHHRDGVDCGILYAGFTLSCCLVECFGDTGVIDDQGRRLAFLVTRRPLHLLELRGRGAMRAGSVAALASTADRDLSQDWSRHFHATYPQIDGLIYSSAHNEEAAVALYERADPNLHCELDWPLDHRSLRSRILKIASDHAMEAPPAAQMRAQK